MVKVLQELIPKGTYFKQNSDGMHIHGYLKSNLDVVKENVLKKDYDSFIIITGREGFGKSTLAAQMALYLDPTYNLDRCTFTSEQFQEACQFAKKGEAVVFDESMGYLSSRGSMSKFNRDLIKIFSEMRSKNLFIIICIPNFFELDKYAALHRSTGLLHVYKRGRFGSYDYKAKKNLYMSGKKFYSMVVPPNFIGNFTGFFVYNKKAYEKKKQEAINSWIENKGQDNINKNRLLSLIKEVYQRKFLNQREIAEIIGVSKSYMGDLLGNEAGGEI